MNTENLGTDIANDAGQNDEQIGVDDLRIGMFVSSLDRPWLGTPFLLQGFLVESEKELAQLRQLCQHVFIDRRRSIGKHFSERPRTPVSLKTDGTSTRTVSYTTAGTDPEQSNFFAFIRKLRKRRPDKPADAEQAAIQRRSLPPAPGSTLEEEMVYAAPIVDDAHRTLVAVEQATDASGFVELDKVHGLIEEMAASVERNPDALLWLTRLRTTDQYSYDHAVDVSVHLMVFGRFLGLGRRNIEMLGQAGLMQDIGKVRLPPDLLGKTPPLSEAESEQLRAHVGYSVEMLRDSGNFPPEVIETVKGHHERYDGSGYPKGLRGDNIGMDAELAGLIDTYCAMTRRRVFRPAVSSQKALETLSRLRDTQFRAAIVDQFVQCVGLYPIGSLVELNSGEVAIVIQQNQVRRLKPRLLILLAPDKSVERHPRNLDLIYEPSTPTGEPYRIIKALPLNAYGIDPTEFFLG